MFCLHQYRYNKLLFSVVNVSPRWGDSALRAQYLPPRGRWPGVWQRAANQNHNDCRWQSFLNYTPGRKRNGDILRAECRKSKMVQRRNSYHFNQLPWISEHFAVPLQSQEMVPKSHFLCQLPPGGSYFAPHGGARRP